jgi:hypothetical protein
VTDRYDYHTLDFPLKTDRLADQSIDFLPYGTRTLKIKVTNPERVRGKLVMRSNKVPQGFGDRVFYSHEEDGTNLRVTWGGGHKRGACLLGRDRMLVGKKVPIQECVELLEQPESYVYLNITHVDGPFDKAYALTLSVHREEDPVDANPLFKLPVALTPPQQVRDRQVQDPVRFDHETYTFRGTHAPNYLNRWWSPEEVSYPLDVPPLPDLRFHIEGNLLKTRIAAGTDRRGAKKFKTIAQVQDNIPFQDVIDEARYFDAELYHLTKHFFVLRLWFSWLEQRSYETALDEIPDAERFDFVIDGRKCQIVYAATDFHWREAWAPAPRNPRLYVKAHIGLFSEEGRGFLAEKFPLDGWLSQVEELIKQESETAKRRVPADDVVRRALEEGLKAEDLGIGFEAHVPYLENCDRPESIDFISSDPTKG